MGCDENAIKIIKLYKYCELCDQMFAIDYNGIFQFNYFNLCFG